MKKQHKTGHRFVARLLLIIFCLQSCENHSIPGPRTAKGKNFNVKGIQEQQELKVHTFSKGYLQVEEDSASKNIEESSSLVILPTNGLASEAKEVTSDNFKSSTPYKLSDSNISTYVQKSCLEKKNVNNKAERAQLQVENKKKNKDLSLIGKPFTAQGGHTVTFYDYKDQIQASVEIVDEKDKVFNRMPVRIGEGADLVGLPNMPEHMQKNRICVQFAENKQPVEVIIHHGTLILGGMKEKNTNGEEKDKGKEKLDEDEEYINHEQHKVQGKQPEEDRVAEEEEKDELQNDLFLKRARMYHPVTSITIGQESSTRPAQEEEEIEGVKVVVLQPQITTADQQRVMELETLLQRTEKNEERNERVKTIIELMMMCVELAPGFFIKYITSRSLGASIMSLSIEFLRLIANSSISYFSFFQKSERSSQQFNKDTKIRGLACIGISCITFLGQICLFLSELIEAELIEEGNHSRNLQISGGLIYGFSFLLYLYFVAYPVFFKRY
jgi:hypothetical protein